MFELLQLIQWRLASTSLHPRNKPTISALWKIRKLILLWVSGVGFERCLVLFYRDGKALNTDKCCNKVWSEAFHSTFNVACQRYRDRLILWSKKTKFRAKISLKSHTKCILYCSDKPIHVFLPDSSLFLTPPPKWSCFFLCPAVLVSVPQSHCCLRRVNTADSSWEHLSTWPHWLPWYSFKENFCVSFSFGDPRCTAAHPFGFPRVPLFFYLIFYIYISSSFTHQVPSLCKTILTYLLLRSLHNWSKTGSAASLDTRKKKWSGVTSEKKKKREVQN